MLRGVFASALFDIETFTHCSLWKEGAFVWQALFEIERYLEDYSHHVAIQIPSFIYIKHPDKISIGEGTVIEPNVYIEGPCIIGKNCHIAHGAYLRKNLIFGDGVSVGHSAEAKHSIVLNGAKLTHFTYVGDSIIGAHVNLGAGVKCANLRLDQKEIKIDGIATGLRKLGAMIGDDAQIGCNSVLNPGTVIPRESLVFPLSNVRGIYRAVSKAN